MLGAAAGERSRHRADYLQRYGGGNRQLVMRSRKAATSPAG
jgi:hypothetical protein